jgi:hypothetical protein
LGAVGLIGKNNDIMAIGEEGVGFFVWAEGKFFKGGADDFATFHRI